MLIKKKYYLVASVINGAIIWLLHFVTEFTAIRNNTLGYSDLIYHYIGVFIGALFFLIKISKYNKNKILMIAVSSLTLSQIILINTSNPAIARFTLFIAGFSVGNSVVLAYPYIYDIMNKIELNGKINYLSYMIIAVCVITATIFDMMHSNYLLSILMIILLLIFLICVLKNKNNEYERLNRHPLKFYFNHISHNSINYSYFLLSFFIGFFFINTYYSIILLLDIKGYLINDFTTFNKFIMILFITCFLFSFPIGVLYDHLGRKWMILLGFYINAIAFLVISISNTFNSLMLYVILPFLIGLGFTLSIFGGFLMVNLELAPKEFIIEHNSMSWIFFAMGLIIAHITDQFLYKYLQEQIIIMPLIIIFTYFTATIIVFQIKESLPSRKEMEWKKKIDLLLILTKYGIPIYSYEFEKYNNNNQHNTDTILTGGALVGISTMIKELTSKSNLKVIRQENYCIMLEETEHVILAIMASEELKIIRDHMIEFIMEFESFFSDVFDSWNSNTVVFLPTKKLVEKYFI